MVSTMMTRTAVARMLRALVRVPAVVVVAGLVACPASSPGSDDDEEVEDCPLGEVTATSTGESIGGCLTAAVTTAASITLTFGDEVSIDIDLFGEPPALPEGWDDVNSATFATIRRGELEWRIADGSLDGSTTGEAETTVTARDGDTLHGTFRGVAVSTSLDALVENLFVDGTF